jgi:hypothetical protein
VVDDPEREIEKAKRENAALRERDNDLRKEFQKAEQINRRTFEQLEQLKAESSRLLKLNRGSDGRFRPITSEAIREEIDQERKRSMGAEENIKRRTT